MAEHDSQFHFTQLDGKLADLDLRVNKLEQLAGIVPTPPVDDQAEAWKQRSAETNHGMDEVAGTDDDSPPVAGVTDGARTDQ